MNQIPLPLQKIIKSINGYHKFDPKSYEIIIKGYYIAEKYFSSHGAEVNHSISHALSVAQDIADWRFDYLAVTAAILHDIPIDAIKSDLDQGIFFILQNFKDIKKQLREFEKHHDISKTENTEMFLRDPVPESLYIKIAERINLLSQADIPEEELLSLAQNTREILVPQVKYIKAFKLADILLDLCLKIENSSVYTSIINKINEIKLYNEYYQKSVLKKMDQIFDRHSKIISDSLHIEQSYVKNFAFDLRSVISIYRHIYRTASNWPDDFNLLMTKQLIPLYDLTLVIDDRISSNPTLSATDIFFNYYNQHLRKERIYILNYSRTTYQDAGYFIICDQMNNLYRIFIKTETEYLHYLFGGIIERDKFSFNFEKRGERIKIFKRDGSATLIERGASVLDLAFMIHSDLGLHFDYALLNNNTQYQPAYTILNQGDTVVIKTKSEITAEPQWFRYIKTDIAIYHLTKYFTKEIARLKRHQLIEVLTKDGTTAKIEYGATVLDLAFQIHSNLGLHFDYALINGQKQHRPPYTLLNHGDTVVIQASNHITADLQWFRYLKTDNAINQLIKFLTKNS